MFDSNLKCKLCQDNDDLCVSHVLPRFLGKYLKRTSATGFLTAFDEKNKPSRSQDLYKGKLLCKNCESILNEVETFFANTIFHPFKKGELKTIPIDDRIGRFAVSVSLRALWIMQLIKHPIAEKWRSELNDLENEWRNYLLKTPKFIMGKNSHHILLCNKNLLAAGVKYNPNLMHSVLRSAVYYLFEKFEKAYVFSNLAGVQVISMIFPQDLPVSQGTQVYPNQTFGVIKPPGIGWGGYFQNLLELNKNIVSAKSALSDAQKEMILHAINNDPERAIMSEDTRIFMMQQALLYSI